MTIGYRSIIEIDDPRGALAVADEQFRAWLRSKKLDQRTAVARDEWDGPGIYDIGEGTTLTVINKADSEGGYEAQLLELVENSKGRGRWRTRFYAMHRAHETRYSSVLWIETRGLGDKGEEKVPNPPRLVRQLLSDVRSAHNHGVPLLVEPEPVRRPSEIERLIAHIRNPERTVSLIVAAPVGHGIDMKEKWRDALSSLTKESLGCASFFVLEDDAFGIFNERMAKGLRLPKGCLRTYCPRVDPHDPVNLRRHRVLTPQRMVSEFDDRRRRFSPRLARTISTQPLINAWQAPLPLELVVAERLLEKRRLGLARVVPKAHEPGPQPRAALMAASPGGGAPVPQQPRFRPAEATAGTERTRSWKDRLRAFLARFTGGRAMRSATDLVAAIDEAEAAFTRLDAEKQDALDEAERRRDECETLRRTAEENLELADGVNDELTELKMQYDDAQLDVSILEEEQRVLEKKVRRLEWQVRNPGSHASGATAEDWLDGPPDSVAEIVDRLTDGSSKYALVRKYVELSDPDKVLEGAYRVDAVDASRFATAFWKYILVLMDYMRACEAGDFKGGVHKYLEESRFPYHTCPQSRHKPTESDTVRTGKRMRAERTFRVPVDVDSRGRIEMWAHFAPTGGGQTAPRMHYYADTRKTHKIYIGYIGPHLTNTKTN